MQENKLVTLRNPTISVEVFNPFTGALTVHCDAEYPEAMQYVNLPILRLSIEDMVGGIVVDDDYSMHLPYLKAIPAFRDFIISQLNHFARTGKSDPLIINGIKQYIKELRGYSSVKSLVRQAKSAVNTLQHEHPAAEAMARAILAALGRTPGTDIGFAFKRSG